MKLLIHDYAGHPFQVQLSRALAQRGHTVTHAYCATVEGAKGNLTRADDDPPTLQIHPLSTREPIRKYHFVKRWLQEREYGQVFNQLISTLRPDLILSANTPLEAQQRGLKQAQQLGIPFIFWVQDLNGVATYQILRQKLPIVGSWIGKYYKAVEKRLLSSSDAIVLISEGFMPVIQEYIGQRTNTHVIPNWAPLNELVPTSQHNPWSVTQGLAGKTVFLYAGMLGFKHNPQLLLQLAISMHSRPEVQVVVISQGIGADWLKEQKQQQQLDNLQILPFQPYEQMSQVLSTATVLLAILEPDAAAYSVPSKILSYLCMGRPLLIAVPQANLGAQIVSEHHCGYVVSPNDELAFVQSAEKLLQNTNQQQAMGKNALHYAQQHFDIERIATQFEQIFHKVKSCKEQH